MEKELIRKALQTGDAVGQPIYRFDGKDWHIKVVTLQPTWEMHGQ